MFPEETFGSDPGQEVAEKWAKPALKRHIACFDKSQGARETAQEIETMIKSTITLLLCATLVALASCTSTGGNERADLDHLSRESPDTLVGRLYRDHNAGRGPFFQTKNRGLVDQYFAESFADAIWEDAVNPKGFGAMHGVGADPLYDAQDTDIESFNISKPTTPGGNGDRATVTVSFENFGQKRTFDYFLIRESNAWKIDDIDYGSHTLRTQF